MNRNGKHDTNKKRTAEPTAGASGNAFSVLMSSTKKRAGSLRNMTKVSARFVLCPAGCGMHIAEPNIHRHLDQCIQQDKEPHQNITSQRPGEEASTFVSPLPTTQGGKQIFSPSNQTGSVPKQPLSQGDGSLEQIIDVSGVVEISSESNDNRGRRSQSPISEEKNAFHHLMTQSRMQSTQQEITSEETTPSIYLCLSNRGKNDQCVVSLEAPTVHHGSVPTAWEGTVHVVDRSQDLPYRCFVGLRSSIPSKLDATIGMTSPPEQEQSQQQQHPKRRWVRQHSRLSVPVLKSVLQKSIRRRRPLPSVRVAMELADKSLGDLLRRLPIIILEDSTLHPQLPFLVWLMMAHSCSSTESYNIPDVLMERVFAIIFQVASCRLRDPLPPKHDNSTTGRRISLSYLLQNFSGSDEDAKNGLLDSTLVPFSILVRSCYGGMKCDVVMLQEYASLWFHRFSSISSETCSHPLSFACMKVSSVSSWREVPAVLHDESSKIQRSGHLSALLQNRLECLTLDDASCEGVDFHCSNIMDHLLNDSWLVGVASDIIKLADDEGEDSLANIKGNERLIWFEKRWKSDMWHYCSGVNHRLPLVDSEKSVKPRPSIKTDTAHARVWKELVAPKVAQFQRDYIRHRLAYC